MKYIKSLLMCALAVVAMTSCDKWLNINENPEVPTSVSATIETRLPWCEYHVLLTEGVAGFRTTMACGDWTRTSTNGGNYLLAAYWNPVNGICTTPYQQFFVGGACNFEDLYNKAMAQGAYHFAGCAKVFGAIGYMIMTDLYGEMPYTEACGESATPTYDDGKTIYLGCLAELEEAIELFNKPQEAGAPSLAGCDWWNNGDVNKWSKLAHLLKARYGVKLSKKAAGKLEEGKYDKQAILDALAKGPQSVNDNTAVQFEDYGESYGTSLYGDPTDFGAYFSVLGMNAGYMVTEAFVKNLTDFDGKGIEDPRADKIIPWQVSAKSADTPEGVKFSGEWRRSLGVDMLSEDSPVSNGGPIRSQFGGAGDGVYAGQDMSGKWWCNTSNPSRLADTLYIEATCGSTGYSKGKDLYFRRSGTEDRSRESGTFIARATAPQYVGTYSEACFIKAEVLFNAGELDGAFNAYKDGIKASMDEMNIVLRKDLAKYPELASCPSFSVMEQADIDNYLANAIGTKADLTLGKIMTQKKIAMQMNLQIWNDMRRYDYDEDIFMNWGIADNYYKTAAAKLSIPEGKAWRRWRQCSHELNYNSTNLQAIGSKVPGAVLDHDGGWNNHPEVWTINVWWDSTQE